MQNLLDSHDTYRLATMIANPAIQPYREWGQTYNSSNVKDLKNIDNIITTKPSKEVYDKLKLMVIFHFTYLGSPMIYYGTER